MVAFAPMGMIPQCAKGGILIEAEEQRRWWFATHPEYSVSSKGQKGSKNSNGTIPEKVDEWVDERLKCEKNPVTRELLRLTKRFFGTEGQTSGSAEESKKESEREAKYRDGWKEATKRSTREKLHPI
jgi:hypothetical protein